MQGDCHVATLLAMTVLVHVIASECEAIFKDRIIQTNSNTPIS